MDPLTIALAALQLGGHGFNLYEQNRMNRAEGAFGRAQGEASVRDAANAQAQMQEDVGRRRRMLMESLANRGVEDSTIARDDSSYLDRQSGRQLQGAADRTNLAQQGLSLFKKQIKSKRRSNYVNFGTKVLGAGLGAGIGMNSAPGGSPADLNGGAWL